MVIGIDHGNSQIKTVHSVFTSGITEHGVRPPMAEDLIEYNDKFYTLTTERKAYARDKTKDDSCFIMTLFAIAKELIESEQDTSEETRIDLAIGLPPEHYGSLKDSFVSYFKNHEETISYKYNGKKFMILIGDVFVFPQAFAAITSRASDLKTYSRTYVVDIGGYTTDVLLLCNGKPDLSYCNSLELGIIKMNNVIKHRVNSKYDMQIADEHITDVLSNKKTMLNDEIKSFINEEAKSHTEKILDHLRELGIDLKANPAIFVGGGSLLLKTFIENSSKTSTLEFIPEISANAIGYTILANGIQRQRSKSN